MLCEVQSPLPPATRVGRSLLTVGLIAPLLYTGYIGLYYHRAWKLQLTPDAILTEPMVVAYVLLMLYGLVTGAAHGLMGYGFERDRTRWIGLGAAAGIAACVIYASACIVQWYSFATNALPGDARWVAHSKWPPFLLFAVFCAWVYLSAFKAANGGRAQSQLPGVLAILAGLLYCANASLVALRSEQDSVLERLLSFWPALYGLLLGGLLMAVACQLMDLRPNDSRPLPPTMASV